MDYLQEDGLSNADKHFVFVGDSFTSGTGGYSWTAHLRDLLSKTHKDLKIYNLGISGTGIIHFEKLLARASHHFKYKNIFIFGLSNDFYRSYWVPKYDGSYILFCEDTSASEGCRKIARTIRGDENASGIRLKSEALSHESDRAVAETALSVFQESRLIRLGAIVTNRLKNNLKMIARAEDSYAALEKIKKSNPEANIYFYHFPEKSEVIIGRYQHDPRKRVESIGITYIPALYKYTWNLDMFHNNDGHPNKHGYDRISDYVKELILDILNDRPII